MENSGIPKLLFQQILLLPQFIFTKIYDSKNKSKKGQTRLWLSVSAYCRFESFTSMLLFRSFLYVKLIRLVL